MHDGTAARALVLMAVNSSRQSDMKTAFIPPGFSDFYTHSNYSEGTLDRVRELEEVVQETATQLDRGELHVAAAFNKTSAIEKKIRGLLRPEDFRQLQAGEIFQHRPAQSLAHASVIYRAARERPSAQRTALEKAVLHLHASTLLGKTLNHIKSHWARTAHIANRQYREENNGLPPFRKTDGTPIVLQKMISKEGVGRSGRRYKAADAWPFISPHLSNEERAALYDKLFLREVLKCDLRDENEELMIRRKEHTVVATEDIPAGTCVGVYGGYALDEHAYDEWPDQEDSSDEDPDIEPDHTYMFDVSKKYKGDIREVDGKNIIAFINTLFVWKNGVPVAQAKDGYNVEYVDFEVLSAKGKVEHIGFVFATEDIEAGTDLRIHEGFKKPFFRLFATKLKRWLGAAGGEQS
jgi:hypothetical protein